MTSQTSGELGAFLKARRAQLRPDEFGLIETHSRRKVPGLRRSEIAQLAAISVEYYTRLEQGRVPASAAVLETLARAMRLDSDQQKYLYELAGRSDARPRRRPVRRHSGSPITCFVFAPRAVTTGRPKPYLSVLTCEVGECARR